MENLGDVVQAPQLNNQGLRAHFHRLRILSGMLVVVSVIVTIMVVLQGNGVTIESFPKGSKTEEQIKQLLDNYNSITGSLSLFVTKPVDAFLGLFVASAFLCLATNFTLDKGSVGYWQYLPLVTGAALAYLFSNGLNSLNVQVTQGSITPYITAEDLSFTKQVVDDQPLRADGSLSTTWNRSYLENTSDNSVLNTILRTKLLPMESMKTLCSGTGVDDIVNPLVSVPLVTFGFESQTWQSEILATALTPTGSLKIPMTINKSRELPSDSRLPMPANVATNLFYLGLDAFYQLPLNQVGAVPPFYNTDTNGAHTITEVLKQSPSTSPSSAGTKSTYSLIDKSHPYLLKAIVTTPNASVNGSSVEYNRFQISNKITFDAMTFEIPVAKAHFDKSGKLVTYLRGFDVYTEDYCTRQGCILYSTAIEYWKKMVTIQPSVQVVSICLNDNGTEEFTVVRDGDSLSSPCSQVSKTSMFVIGIGIRLEGDVWSHPADVYPTSTRFDNMRTVYSITAGRLSWETEDLAPAFGAKCDAKLLDCEGLRFNMQSDSNKSDFVIVGRDSLPVKDLSHYDLENTDKSRWKFLVSVGDGLGAQGNDVVLPRRFSRITANGSELMEHPLDKCNTFAEAYINTVEKNHLYMERSLQTSYTAAFYFLFQNAVRRSKLNTIGETSGLPSRSLAFAGNVQLLNVQVSIPPTNAVISLVGCLLLMVGSISVTCLARRSEHLLQERANAALVAEAMMNSSKYPPLLLKMALEQTDAEQENQEFLLQDLRVQSVLLHHEAEKNQLVFHVGSEMSKSHPL